MIAPPDLAAPLTFAEVRAVLRSCPLTAHQRAIVYQVLEGRTLDEIGLWSVLDDAGKREVRAALDRRRENQAPGPSPRAVGPE